MTKRIEFWLDSAKGGLMILGTTLVTLLVLDILNLIVNPETMPRLGKTEFVIRHYFVFASFSFLFGVMTKILVILRNRMKS